MGFKRNTLPDLEHKRRSIEIIDRINKGEQTRETMVELYFLHNDKLKSRESCMTCKGARDRVFSKLKALYNL